MDDEKLADYKVVVSVPVHENLEVAKDQVMNLKRYISDAGIIIHISDSFERKISNHGEIEDIEDVYINEQHIDTDEKGIIYAHISNYYYALRHCKFDYFLMHASNDMYIRTGITDYLYRYDAGFHIHKISCISQWWPGNYGLQDRQLLFMLKENGISTIVGTQIESSFYKTEVFGKIVKIIEESRLYEDATLKYPREEIYFSTIAYHIVDRNRIGYPTTFSEVHRYDRCLWKLRYLTWGIYHRLRMEKIVPIQQYDRFERWYSEILFRSKSYKITPRIVRVLLDSNKEFLHRNRYLDDGRNRYQLYGNEIFAVKRVKRDINDMLRRYINGLEECNER